MKQILFVSGVARSGTSALVNVLNTNPDFLIGMERFFFRIRRKLLKPDDFEEDRFLTVKQGDTHAPGFDREAIRKSYSVAKIIGDKFPLLYENFDYIFDTFPNARHIYIVRNPLSVAESYDARKQDKSDKWIKSGLVGIQEWNSSVNSVVSLSQDRLDKFHFLQYEEFFSDVAAMNRLFAHYGAQATDESRLSKFVDRFSALNRKLVERRDDIRQAVAENCDWAAYRELLRMINLQNKVPIPLSPANAGNKDDHQKAATKHQ